MPRAKKTIEAEPTPKAKKDKFFYGTGRRKRAVARVFLYKKKGDILVNDVLVSDFYKTEKEIQTIFKPFHTVGISYPSTEYSATVKVFGSGTESQLGAISLGFARALVESNEEFRPTLRSQGLLTRDPREVERKKYYLRKARKRPQYSKR